MAVPTCDDERERNPFLTSWSPRWGWTGAQDAASRIELARGFDPTQCRAALRLRHLQKTVRAAVRRRLTRLGETL